LQYYVSLVLNLNIKIYQAKSIPLKSKVKRVRPITDEAAFVYLISSAPAAPVIRGQQIQKRFDCPG